MRRFLLVFTIVIGGLFITFSPVAAQDVNEDTKQQNLQQAPPTYSVTIKRENGGHFLYYEVVHPTYKIPYRGYLQRSGVDGRMLVYKGTLYRYDLPYPIPFSHRDLVPLAS